MNYLNVRKGSRKLRRNLVEESPSKEERSWFLLKGMDDRTLVGQKIFTSPLRRPGCVEQCEVLPRRTGLSCDRQRKIPAGRTHRKRGKNNCLHYYRHYRYYYIHLSLWNMEHSEIHIQFINHSHSTYSWNEYLNQTT